MKTEVQEKISMKPLMECLEKIPEEQLEELYEESLKIVKEKKQKKVSKEEKVEYIYGNLIAKYITLLLFLSSDEIKTLEEAIYNNDLTKISQKLIDNNYIFKIEDKYLIPEELKEIIKESNAKELEDDKKNLFVNYYIISNGVLKFERLQSLVKESGLKITKKEITKIAEQYNYIIKNNTIYINEIAESLDEDNDLIGIKESIDYKVVSFEEAMKKMMLIENINATEEISKLLKKKVKNKQKLSVIAETIFSFILLTEDFEDLVEDALEDFEVNLNEDELDELYGLLEDISHVTPTWELNGYTPHEMYCDEEDEYEDEYSFDDLPEEEKKEIYIFNYIMINGIISIDKLVELLNENHHIKTNKKDIIKIVKNSDLTEETTIIGDYLCQLNFSKEDFEMIKSLKKLDKYKVIDDIEELMDELEDNDIKYNSICDEYKLPEEIVDELNAIMVLGGLTEETIPMIFESHKFTMPLKKQQAFFKELKSIIRNTRMWILNGYTPMELNNTSKSEKIGRNDKCPCGSGKKYKQCCGK